MLADLFNGLFLALIEDDLVLFEQIASFGVDGDDEWAELLDTAVPEGLRHTEVTPLSIDDLLHLGGSDDRVAGREHTVDSAEIVQGLAV